MLKHLLTATILAATATFASAQGVAFFQDGINGYDGTIDNEFRAAAPSVSQSENTNISVDQFDSGFQTQGAIRFENILASDGGFLPDELPAEDILFAEFRIWKQSPTQSNANIDFNRVLGPDTTSGAVWGNDDTWSSLGGDLTPDINGLLDGDPILRDGIEAAETPDFQDNGDRFADDSFVVVDPTEDPLPSSLVYRADVDSENIFDLAGGQSASSPAELARAIDVAFFRFDVTDAIRDWFADTDASTAGTQPAQANLGWAISNDTGDGWDFRTSEIATSFEGEFDDFTEEEIFQFRPALTIIFDDGSAGPLDINKDGVVDLADFPLFVDLLGSELDSPLSTGAPGDFDFDRDVDLDDFRFFKENFPGGAAALAAAIPEPSSILAGLLGLVGLGLSNRRRNG